MKYFKLLPVAAGVIALTATMAFARDQREAIKDNLPRIRVEAYELDNSSGDAMAGLLPAAIDSETGDVYLVEAARVREKDGDDEQAV